MRELLAPLEQTASLCGMVWAPPYVIHGTHRLSEAQIDTEAQRYGQLLIDLHEARVDLRATTRYPSLNHALAGVRVEGDR